MKKKIEGFVISGTMGDVNIVTLNVDSYMKNLLNVDLEETVIEADVCFITPSMPIFPPNKNSGSIHGVVQIQD